MSSIKLEEYSELLEQMVPEINDVLERLKTTCIKWAIASLKNQHNHKVTDYATGNGLCH